MREMDVGSGQHECAVEREGITDCLLEATLKIAKCRLGVAESDMFRETGGNNTEYKQNLQFRLLIIKH